MTKYRQYGSLGGVTLISSYVMLHSIGIHWHINWRTHTRTLSLRHQSKVRAYGSLWWFTTSHWSAAGSPIHLPHSDTASPTSPVSSLHYSITSVPHPPLSNRDSPLIVLSPPSSRFIGSLLMILMPFTLRYSPGTDVKLRLNWKTVTKGIRLSESYSFSPNYFKYLCQNKIWK